MKIFHYYDHCLKCFKAIVLFYINLGMHTITKQNECQVKNTQQRLGHIKDDHILTIIDVVVL